MSHFDAYADAIAQETLLEMAENFFGERTSIDDEKDHFFAQAKALREQCDTALEKAALLHALLVTDENIHDFYFLLDVRPGPYFLWVDPQQAQLWFPMPFAFTMKGRYVRLLLRAYDQVQQAFDAYMNGAYHTIPGTGQKRLSMNYKLLTEWSGHINRRIRKVNEGLAPSCVLGFAHCMDVDAVQKERLTGATMNDYCCSLDQSLEIAPVSCHEEQVRALPELPPLKDVQKVLGIYARQVYRAHKAELRPLLRRLRHGS